MFAQAIHNGSRRCSGPFVAINCAAIPRDLLESEIFGYVGGAFTGARKGGQVGKLELADGGTVFLDEISQMPLDLQAKLLRVLQDGMITRLGDTKPVHIDTRVVAATNEDLVEKAVPAVSASTFITVWGWSKCRCRRCANASATFPARRIHPWPHFAEIRRTECRRLSCRHGLSGSL